MQPRTSSFCLGFTEPNLLLFNANNDVFVTEPKPFQTQGGRRDLRDSGVCCEGCSAALVAAPVAGGPSHSPACPRLPHPRQPEDTRSTCASRIPGSRGTAVTGCHLVASGAARLLLLTLPAFSSSRKNISCCCRCFCWFGFGSEAVRQGLSCTEGWPVESWGALGRVWSVGWGRWSSPSGRAQWGHIWSAVPSPELLSTRETRDTGQCPVRTRKMMRGLEHLSYEETAGAGPV